MTSIDPGIRLRLLSAREAAKFTQEEAASEVGMSRQKLGRCERGDASPSLEELKGLCLLYGITPNYVMFGEDLTSTIGRAMKAAVGASGKPVSAAASGPAS